MEPGTAAKKWFMTGSRGGLGRQLVRTVLEHGDRVFATDLRAEGLAELVAEFDERVAVAALDVTDPDAVEAVLQRTLATLGGLDVVVNGTGYRGVGSIEDMSADEFRRTIDINFYGTVNVSRAAVSLLRPKRGGTLSRSRPSEAAVLRQASARTRHRSGPSAASRNPGSGNGSVGCPCDSSRTKRHADLVRTEADCHIATSMELLASVWRFTSDPGQGRQDMVELWINREGQTLAVIVEHFARPGADPLWLSQLAELTGVAEPELEHRLDRLARGEFIGVDRRARAIAGVVEVLPKGWQVSTGEPNDQGTAVEMLVGELAIAVERETDPKRKGILSDLRTAVRIFSLELGLKMSAELLAKWMKIDYRSGCRRKERPVAQSDRAGPQSVRRSMCPGSPLGGWRDAVPAGRNSAMAMG